MKKLYFSFLLAIIACVSAFGQISATPFKTNPDDGVYGFTTVFNYSNSEKQVIIRGIYQYGGNKICIYDLSLSLLKTVTVPASLGDGFYFTSVNLNNETSRIGVSDVLFNNDDKLEFFVISGIYSSKDVFAIVNEDGDILFQKSGSYGDVTILNTKNGNLMEISNLYENSIEYYALNGYNVNGVRSTTIQKLDFPYPNPAEAYINLPYTLPSGVPSGTIRVYNMSGNLLQTFTVDGAFEYVRFETSNLPAGTYIYNLEVNGQLSEGKQFIVK